MRQNLGIKVDEFKNVLTTQKKMIKELTNPTWLTLNGKIIFYSFFIFILFFYMFFQNKTND